MTSHNGACLEDGFSKLMFFFFMVAFIFHFAASKPWLNDRFQPWATDDLLLNMPKWRRPWVVTCDTRYNFMMVIRGVRAASSTSFPPPPNVFVPNSPLELHPQPVYFFAILIVSPLKIILESVTQLNGKIKFSQILENPNNV